jgi:DtxR family Mn-dependent transcriptional regulator
MTDHNNSGMSESEEMYLITVARLVEQGVEGPVAISQLAEALSILPVSANQMVHKLAEEGWLEYLPYKGVKLTAEGQHVALKVLRDRRLWEVFLVEQLHFSSNEADTLACRLEHITPKKLANQLAAFLDFPAVSPQGLPIPDLKIESNDDNAQPLVELTVGQTAVVAQIAGDPATEAFLGNQGIRSGAEIRLLAVASGQDMLLQVGHQRIYISDDVANDIFIRVKTPVEVQAAQVASPGVDLDR